MIVIDAEDAVVGRLAAVIAKKLLLNEQVIVVNAEKSFFSGPEKRVSLVYFKRRRMQNKADPEKTAKWPRRPDYLLKKIVKGMLPHKTSRQSNALRNLTVFAGVPEKYVNVPKESFKTTLGRKKVSLQKVCENLGWVKKVI
jgi:large subunit ribosomal protein L13